MPLNTQIIRGGEAMQLRWGDFHVAAMALAASFDSDDCDNAINDPTKVYEAPAEMFECYPDAPFPITREIAFHLTNYGALGKTPLNDGHYTLKNRHAFIDTTDGEILRLQPGDELIAVRN